MREMDNEQVKAESIVTLPMIFKKNHCVCTFQIKFIMFKLDDDP